MISSAPAVRLTPEGLISNDLRKRAGDHGTIEMTVPIESFCLFSDSIGVEDKCLQATATQSQEEVRVCEDLQPPCSPQGNKIRGVRLLRR